MSKVRSWTDEQLKVAVKESFSIAQVIKSIGLIPAGGNYKSIEAHIARLQLDTSHFLGQGWNKGGTSNPKKIPLEEILVVNSTYRSSHNLRQRLLRACILDHVCSSCGFHTWNGQPIPLELDHVNGIHTDNRLENLRMLCPNCHAQTPTYRGKNKKGRRR